MFWMGMSFLFWKNNFLLDYSCLFWEFNILSFSQIFHIVHILTHTRISPQQGLFSFGSDNHLENGNTIGLDCIIAYYHHFWTSIHVSLHLFVSSPMSRLFLWFSIMNPYIPYNIHFLFTIKPRYSEKVHQTLFVHYIK